MKMINIKKTNENAKTPTYGSEFAAGADLYAVVHNFPVKQLLLTQGL